MGCCGGKNSTKQVQTPSQEARMHAMAAATPASGMVQMVYRGPRKGDFVIVSGPTRTRYRVPGQGEFVEQPEKAIRGVVPADVPWFRSVAQGQHFQVVEAPRPAPVVQQAAAVPETPREDSEAWKPEIMEEKAPDVRSSRKRGK